MSPSARLDIAGRRLFTARRPAWPLAIARIIIGLTIFLWSITMLFDVTALLGENAVVSPELASDRFRWITLDTSTEIRLGMVGLTLASLAIIVGWKPTIWLLVAFVLLEGLFWMGSRDSLRKYYQRAEMVLRE